MSANPPSAGAVNAPSKTTGYAWYVAALLSAAYLLSVMDRYLLGVVQEEVKVALQLTDTQLGVLQGPSFVLLFLLASVPFGRLADIMSRKILIIIGLVCWSVATAACGLAQNYTELLIARGMVGLGEAALMPSAMSLIVAYFSRDKLSRGVSVYQMGASLGRAAAFAGGGALFTIFAARGGLPFPVFGVLEPWRAVFVAAAIGGIFFTTAFGLTLREPVRQPRPATGAGLKDGLQYFWDKRWAYLAVFIPFTMISSVAAQLAAWAVSFYVRKHGIPASEAAGMIGLTGLAIGPAANLFAGWFNDKLNNTGHANTQPIVLTALLPIILISMTILLLSPTVWVAAIAYGAAYFCLCMAGPTGLSGIQLLTPDVHRGTLSSISLVFYSGLGAAIGPLLVGLFGDHVFSESDLGGSMLATTIVLAIVGIFFGLAGRKPFSRAAQAIHGAAAA